MSEVRICGNGIVKDKLMLLYTLSFTTAHMKTGLMSNVVKEIYENSSQIKRIALERDACLTLYLILFTILCQGK